MLNREKLHFRRSSQFHSGNDTLRGPTGSQTGDRPAGALPRPRFAATALTARLRPGEETFMRSRQALSTNAPKSDARAAA
jgi:hypothetical protein